MKLPDIIKNIDIDKAIKISIIASILLVSISFFYYYVIFLPHKEQARIEQEKHDQLTKELKEQEAKKEAAQSLNTCIADAEKNYSDQWHRECKSRGLLTNKCIDINELSFDEYLKKYGLTAEDYVRERGLAPDNPSDSFSVRISAVFDYVKRASDDCSCRLPVTIADSIGDYRNKLKDECFKKYPQK